MKTNYPTSPRNRRTAAGLAFMNPNFSPRLATTAAPTARPRFELGRLWDPTLLDRLQMPLSRFLD